MNALQIAYLMALYFTALLLAYRVWKDLHQHFNDIAIDQW